MIEYIYRGFKVSYKIRPTTAEKTTYTANGHTTYLLSVPKFLSLKQFRIEYATYDTTEHEIRKILEHYIDVELQRVYEVREEMLASS